jgi:hypothetical protein
MQKTYFSTEPEKILYQPQSDGTAEVYLRKNIEQTEEGWVADEVQIRTRLTEREILAQLDSYFVEEIETTIGDLVEAIDILTGIVLEG